MGMIDEYKKLSPTRSEWRKWESDSHYIYDGNTGHTALCVMTLSEQDSDFIVWCYKYVPDAMSALTRAAGAVEKYKREYESAEKDRIAADTQRNKFQKRSEKLQILLKKFLDPTTDMFQMEELKKEAKEVMGE